jgi:L-2,4-diaminobutyrate decarboxylase
MPHEDDFTPDVEGLQQALRLLINARSRPGQPHVDPTLPLDLPQQWPAAGLGGDAALNLLARAALEQVSRLDHPGFLAHMDPPTPWMTWAAGMWAAAMNQNLLHPDAAPAARQLEPLVISWLAPAFGMGGGHLLPGSTTANLTALWAARDLTGARRVVCSTAAHLSIAKAARILGLELVQVPVDAAQRLRVDLLPDGLSDAIVVLIAGTVATGAVDPLTPAGDAAWRHVDAAWGGPLRLSSHTGVLEGVQDADSVALSAHKWLYQPKDSALVLFRDPDTAHQALSFGGSYLAAPNIGLLGSHGNTALPLAATLLAWGRHGLAARIDADMALAEHLADLIDDTAELELWRRPVTGVVNWRPRHQASEQVRARLQDAWVSTASIDGATWLRSVAANPRADPQHVVRAVRRALHSL